MRLVHFSGVVFSHITISANVVVRSDAIFQVVAIAQIQRPHQKPSRDRLVQSALKLSKRYTSEFAADVGSRQMLANFIFVRWK